MSLQPYSSRPGTPDLDIVLPTSVLVSDIAVSSDITENTDGNSLLGRLWSVIQSFPTHVTVAWQMFRGWSSWVNSYISGDAACPITYCWGVGGSAVDQTNEIIIWCVECSLNIEGGGIVGKVIVSRQYTDMWRPATLPLYGMWTRDGAIDAWNTVRFALWEHFTPLAQIEVEFGPEGITRTHGSRTMGVGSLNLDRGHDSSAKESWENAIVAKRGLGVHRCRCWGVFPRPTEHRPTRRGEIRAKLLVALDKIHSRSLDFASKQRFWS
jgi:hypothetical protein